MKLLVVEDYVPVRESLCQGFREAGFAVDCSAEGGEGLWYAQTGDYDAVLLDIMLPGVHGLSILETLRQEHDQTPILILTARDALNDRLTGYDLGADDYVVKPFSFHEVLARVRALIRRKYGLSSPLIRIADLEIDTTQRVARHQDREIHFRSREFAVLEYLAHRAGQVCERTAIWDHVYDFNADPNSNVIDVYIRQLRRKFEEHGIPHLIQTRRGLGYVLGPLP
jgi:DNA-binding response OmpR family regulator